MKRVFALLFIIVLVFSCTSQTKEEPTKTYARYVDPFIGTADHGHTYPGATMPFGMVQLSPDTGIREWDWCSGYHSSDSSIMGFSHTHLSGTGGADLADILFMPVSGPVKFEPGPKNDPDLGYRSRFSHDSEKASPGYYAVYLDDYKIKVELSATQRVGIHQYVFDQPDDASVLIDLNHGISDRTKEGYFIAVNDSVIQGYRYSSGWAKDQTVYFSAHFSSPFTKHTGMVDGSINNDSELKGTSVQAALKFDKLNGNKLMVKVALSSVSMEGAEKNLQAEAKGWEFEPYKKKAFDTWDKELSVIQAEDSSVPHLRTFYTALYHAMLVPNVFQDVDGKYRGMDQKIHTAENFDYYTIFSLWDTYRATHPLYSIIKPERNLDFIKTMLRMYEEGGRLPIWELHGNETWCMIGYHSVPVIADAYMKGERGFDANLALEAMVGSADEDKLGIEYYKELGYIPSNKENNSVSKTLEYAFDDWCLAQMAAKMGNKVIRDRFTKRAQYYKNLFDPEVKFMRGKLKNGKWVEPFDPMAVSILGKGDFAEGNSWQYSFYVPQDVNTYIEMFGGDKAFSNKIDELFSQEPVSDNEHALDVTGLIGQYAQGNEPSHHMAYLYNYAGEPHKTMETVTKICSTLYHDGRDGLCGNEDCGQMSSWYIFSSMGFYPVTPASNNYIIGSPQFKKVSVNLPGGKVFTVETENLSPKNIYIQSAKLNGETYTKSYLKHEDLAKGGTLSFVMGPKPSDWGTMPEDRPVSRIDNSSM